MIKTLIFDLGRVIVPFDFQRGYRQLEALCGVPAAEIPTRIGATDLVRRFESGQVDPEEFVSQLNQQLGMRASAEEFSRIWCSIFLPEPLIPDEWLAALHRNYRLLLLSNTNAIHFEMIVETYAILRHFDHFVLSYKVGAMKPSQLIYQEAVRRAGCPAGECFFTDDIPAYVEAARQQGIDAEVFTGVESLQAALRQRGVQW